MTGILTPEQAIAKLKVVRERHQHRMAALELKAFDQAVDVIEELRAERDAATEEWHKAHADFVAENEKVREAEWLLSEAQAERDAFQEQNNVAAEMYHVADKRAQAAKEKASYAAECFDIEFVRAERAERLLSEVRAALSGWEARRNEYGDTFIERGEATTLETLVGPLPYDIAETFEDWIGSLRAAVGGES